MSLHPKALLAAFVLFLLSLINASPTVKRDPVPTGYVAAPYYPAPRGGWLSDWSESYAKAVRLVTNMTLAEKVNITAGTGIFMGRCVGNTGSAPRVRFPQLCLQDGPLGIRNTDHNTAFPAGITVGATWDKDLMYARGAALGEEFRGKGVNIALLPSVGPLGRKPRGGRNWEGFGSDPVLQGIAAMLTIQGTQEQGVIATIKHLIGNEQEMYRMYNPVQPAYSANIDDRTLHELYLWPFAEGVRAGVGSVMCAYNAVNGSASSQNSYLTNKILKDELGFQGFYMTDWLAQISGVAAALAGLDMSMPGDGSIPLFGNSYWMYDLSRAVLNGSVPVSRLNDMVTRIVAAWYQMGQDQDYPEPNFSTNTQDREGPLYPGAVISPRGVVNEFVDVKGSHAEVARAIARDAITLLKNEDNVLPLSTNTSLRVYGSDAQANPDGINSCSDRGCNKGTLGQGWGSGTANYPYLDDPISAIRRRASSVTYSSSDTFPLIQDPVSENDVALVFINADSGENYITVEGNPGDRTTAGLQVWHNGDELVKAAANAFDTVVVIVHTVGPILMEDWIELHSVKAVLFAHLPGQEAGDSLTDILFGDVSPSGHLPYSLVRREDDLPASTQLRGFAIGQPQDTYTEGLYIDYRYLLAQNITPRYAFGHGLSYTTFSFSNASIEQLTTLSTFPPARAPKGTTPQTVYNNTIPPASEVYYPSGFRRINRYLYSWLERPAADAAAHIGATNSSTYPYPVGYSETEKPGPRAGGAQGGNPALWDPIFRVSLSITNTGERAGRAVVQAYVSYPTGTGWDTPPLQLRDFVKTGVLEPGESEAVEVVVSRKAVSVWDTTVQDWRAFTDAGESGYGIWLGEAVDDLRVVCLGSGGCEEVDG
ncbi:glycoside hydrolase family 3 protein [Patellaria atrata CBS 101060]|uniref:Probable beta-glucosidase F n=1 Tax=Patellaria atrata CBS 101060 TaxID=1346257 RepID=A0A9P4S9N9_9PEZI|nr:glycoside hydrolase family 3 protein [Patellaria atrata CBS 101060]